MSARILLVTAADNTHRKPLLESQGYVVDVVPAALVENRLRHPAVPTPYDLALIATEDGVPATLDCCEKMKRIVPRLRIAVIAQRSEYVPPSQAVDAVIRQQYSPGKFLASVKRLLDDAPLGKESSAAAEGE